MGNTNTSAGNYTLTINPTAPVVTITHPKNGWTYDAVISFSFTYVEAHPDSCWYSLNSGSNITLSTCAGTSISPRQGSNTLDVYMNDTSGNLGKDALTFYVQEPAAQGGGGGGGYFESEVIAGDIVDEVPLGCVEQNLTVWTSIPSWFHITPNITDVAASIWVKNHWESEADLFLTKGNNIIKVKLCSDTPGLKLGEIELKQAFELVNMNKTIESITVADVALNVTLAQNVTPGTNQTTQTSQEEPTDDITFWDMIIQNIWAIILIIVLVALGIYYRGAEIG